MTEIVEPMTAKKSSPASVLFFAGIITAILKLCGLVGWSWWWATVGIWGVFALLLLEGFLTELNSLLLGRTK